MPVDSLPSLVDLVRRLQLLPPAQLAELIDSLQTKFPEPRALAGELVRRGWLTPYQINQIFLGRADGLVLGSYVVLERLGEGGMGAVFTARHQKLGRIVAVKLIRKERLTHPDAVRRFYREVQAAAALEHPNIVRAYDAGESNGAHFFVMEHVEGTDLAGLVKQQGPLSIERACDYARQAALGLQHAYERGMVHRDIKPANLLLASKGDVVKVLDMGLARLDRAEADAGVSTTLTQEGAVMGTPDYIAPEQARDSHTADIRADLYSLGCTLYVLLTGRVPFPGGSLTEKLLKHQMDKPRPVEELRPETPPAVAAVVRKLMAKRPENRYQTPAEAAETLAAVLIAPAPSAVNAQTLTEGVAVDPSPEPQRDGDTLATGATAEVVRRAAERRRRQAEQGWRRLALYTVGGLLSLGLGVWLLTLVLRFALPPATVTPTTPPVMAQPPVAPASPTFDDWLKKVAAMKPEEQIKAVADELMKRNPGFDGQVKPEIKDGAVVGLELNAQEVIDLSPIRALRKLTRLACTGFNDWAKLSDLSPLKGLPLTGLNCYHTSVATLEPLRGMPLAYLGCTKTAVTDLAPLEGMKLTRFECNSTPVSDLSPLKGMPLTYLDCGGSKVSDLSPLKDMKLTFLWCQGTPASDLSPLQGMPLQTLWCDFHPGRDAELLRSIKTLTRINDKPAADFWKDVEAQQAEFDAWCKQVAAMKADEQVEAVKAELKKRNPKFDGELTPTVDNGVVVGLAFFTDEVTDVAPVRALAGLRTLTCIGHEGKRRLADLSPLKGMPLTTLSCYSSAVSDLSPLKGMPLTALNCAYTSASDLSPLKDMKLTALYCHGTNVSDLSPLKGMPLTALHFAGTPASDVSPLKDMPLAFLDCHGTNVSDLTPLKDMKLTVLRCDFNPWRDTELLRSIHTLTQINDKPAADFWKEVDAQRAEFDAWCKQVAAMKPDEQVEAVKAELKKRNPGFDGKLTPTLENGAVVGLEFLTDAVTDIAPVRALAKLRTLKCGGTFSDKGLLADLSPLKGVQLTELSCVCSKVADLSPLKDTALERLNCNWTKISDLSPLRGLMLAEMGCAGTRVADLRPLKGMRLQGLDYSNTPISDVSPLKEMPLGSVWCTFKPERDADLLHSIKTLQFINGKLAADFWKEVEAPKP